jgi:Uncharacterized conserved protein (DUF2304)
MPIRQKTFFLAVTAVFMLVVLELVRRRRLRVEYAWLWIGSGIALAVLIVRYELLVWLTGVAGAALPTSTVFFLATLFLALLGLHYSVRLTVLTREVKELAQELALLRGALEAESGAEPDARAAPSPGGTAPEPDAN